MLPFFGNCLVEEGEDRCAELVEGFVVSIMGRVLMHEAPVSLDRIEVWTIGRDEVQHALAPLSLEPFTYALGMMVAGIVQVNMDPSFLGMCSFDRLGLLIRPSRSLPPLEFCLGTSPIQAEKLRPDRKAFGSATVATRAVASAGPTPGQ